MKWCFVLRMCSLCVIHTWIL